MTPVTIAFCVAVAFVLYSLPEVLLKVSLTYDELKTEGALAAFLLMVKMLLGCLKCCAFWTTLVITGSFTLAGCLAFGAHLTDRQ